MRGHRAGRGAAAFCALAVFACAVGCLRFQEASRPQLEIEVIAPAQEDEQAAAMERQPVQPGSAAGAEVRPVSAMDRMRRQTQEAVRPR